MVVSMDEMTVVTMDERWAGEKAARSDVHWVASMDDRMVVPTDVCWAGEKAASTDTT